jgi:uncharacterized membrane-anchored protein YhcB (DUF1043 family)
LSFRTKLMKSFIRIQNFISLQCHQKVTIQCYVWLLVFLGISFGILLFFSIGMINSYIQFEREKSDRFQQETTSFLHIFQLQLNEGKDVLLEYLQFTSKENQSAQWIENLQTETKEYFRQHATNIDTSYLQKMINTISKIQQFHKICTQWNSNYISTRDKTNQARFRIRESINQLHELIDIAEGNYRIELATLIRQYRESPIHQQDETGQNIINAIASYNFSNLKTEISTLNHIIERLLNEANHENFVDYKDNQIKPAFTRINRIVDYLNDSTKSQYSTIAAKIKNLIHILFGEDTQFIDDYQTIESGQQGLYSYLHQLLLLEQDRETYSKQLSNLFEKSNEILYQLNKSFTQQRSDMTIQVGKRIQYASYIIYAIAFILMAVFLIISTTILRVIKRQIKHTHEVNQQLKHQTNDLGKS